MKRKSLILVIFNSITLLLMLFVNYGSNAGLFSERSVAEISHKFDTLFAPAGYAFIIWGFIFLMLITFTVYQWILLKKNDPDNYIQRTGMWLTVSNIANGFWVSLWTNELLGWSVVIILILLLSLIILILRLRLELDDEPVRTIFFVWWPITFYVGWIMVATIACISAWLVSVGWKAWGISESSWTIIMIIIASLFYILLVMKRNMREALLVGIWAFVAIAIRQWNTHSSIAGTAIAVSLVLFIAVSIHGFKNRNFGPGSKLKRGEW
ncbi:MAG: hypothetical protein ABI729_07025 [Chitinophagales bacterium]